MRTMKRRYLYTIGTLAVVVTLGLIGWRLLQPTAPQPRVVYKPAHTETGAIPTSQRTDDPATAAAPTETQTPTDRQQADRDQAIERAMKTPAYREYERKQREKIPGFNMSLWWDFLESQGIPHSGRLLQETYFREEFPTGEYEDYEPMMRKRLAALFVAADLPKEPSHISAVRLDTIQVVSQFRNESWANTIWMRGYFNGYDGDMAWANEIRNNAASILAAPADTASDTETLATHATSTTRPTGSAETPVETQPTRDDAQTAFETLDLALPALEQQLTEHGVPEISNVLNASALKTEMSQRFSPDRFNTALQTLNRYGPEAGLRRLKASDPEVATYLETHLKQQ